MADSPHLLSQYFILCELAMLVGVDKNECQYGEMYDVMNDDIKAAFTCKQKKVKFNFYPEDKSVSLNDFSKRFLVPVVEQWKSDKVPA